MGGLFSFSHPKTPELAAPIVDKAPRTGTKKPLAVVSLFVGLFHNIQNYERFFYDTTRTISFIPTMDNEFFPEDP